MQAMAALMAPFFIPGQTLQAMITSSRDQADVLLLTF